jgi:4-hydroxy-tetrahydrodipicolinate reductase
MGDKMRAVQYGCGPIGCSVTALAARRNNIELVGAVDIDPEKIGKDLGAVAGLEGTLGVTVSSDADDVFAQAQPDLIFHTTGSSFRAVYDQIAGAVKAGVNVVSTCEELSFPYNREPQLSADLDALAKEHGVTVLGTGINPGFLMDLWPLCMTAMCQDVTSVRAVRIQDATTRRLPFQKKIGAGRTPEEFQQLIEEGTLRHVGLPESIEHIAAGLGWKLDEVEETIEPVMAEQSVSSEYMTVEPGQAAGVKQIGYGRRDGEVVVSGEFQAYLGAPESYDAVYIEGKPDMEVVVKGGTHGDIGTAAMTVNAAKRVVAAPAGLLTMKDLPVVVWSDT